MPARRCPLSGENEFLSVSATSPCSAEHVGPRQGLTWACGRSEPVSQLTSAVGLQFQSLAKSEHGCPSKLHFFIGTGDTLPADGSACCCPVPCLPHGGRGLGAQSTAGWPYLPLGLRPQQLSAAPVLDSSKRTLLISLLIYLFESAHGGVGGGAEGTSAAGSPLSTEPNAGLDLMTLRQ